MTLFRFAFCVAIFGVLSVGCGRKQPVAKPLAGPPEPGAIYSLIDGEGGFRAGKVVVAEEDVVFVHLFANRWDSQPSADELTSTKAPLPVAYSPETFAGMTPRLVQQGAVSPEEEETYTAWKNSKQAVF